MEVSNMEVGNMEYPTLRCDANNRRRPEAVCKGQMTRDPFFI